MVPNTSTTETYNKIHPNITPHSYVQEQHKKELNQSQMGKQMQYNQPQVEKTVSREHYRMKLTMNCTKPS